jgi:hypothetical protein
MALEPWLGPGAFRIRVYPWGPKPSEGPNLVGGSVVPTLSHSDGRGRGMSAVREVLRGPK